MKFSDEEIEQYLVKNGATKNIVRKAMEKPPIVELKKHTVVKQFPNSLVTPQTPKQTPKEFLSDLALFLDSIPTQIVIIKPHHTPLLHAARDWAARCRGFQE